MIKQRYENSSGINPYRMILKSSYFACLKRIIELELKILELELKILELELKFATKNLNP